MVPRRVAVVGHVQHVTLGTVAALPAPGDIVHLDDAFWIPGGGGGMSFFQLVRSPSEVHLFTAVGHDDTGQAIVDRLTQTPAIVHAARHDVPHARDVVLVTPNGERTIIVVGAPLQPRFADGLPWDTFAGCDAVYFTGRDPNVLRAARAARVLVVTARRRPVLLQARVRADLVVGSASDPMEASRLADYSPAPAAVVMTEGAAGGSIETAAGIARFPAAPPSGPRVTSYGAGDSFVAALTWYVASGLPVADACRRAAVHGAAVLTTTNPLDAQLPLTAP